MEKALQESLNKIHEKLDKHSEILGEHGKVLGEHSKILGEHSKILGEHSKILGEHSKILEKHTKILDKHSKTLSDHTTKIDHILEREDLLAAKLFEHDERFNAHGERLNKFEKTQDMLLKIMLRQDNRMEEMMEWRKHVLTREEFAQTDDKITKMLEKLDQERIITNHDIKNLEKVTDNHTVEISAIKLKIGIAA